MSSLDPHAVLAAFDVGRRVASVEPVRPGFSDAHVFRCRTNSGQLLALRGWPPQTRLERLREIQWVIQTARANGCQLVPRLCPLSVGPSGDAHGRSPSGNPSGDRHSDQLRAIRHRGRYWELAQWMPGVPLPMSAPAGPICQGVMAIRWFHQAVANLGVRTAPAPAVEARWERCRQLQPLLSRLANLPKFSSSCHELDESVQQARRLIQCQWCRASTRIIDSLSRYRQRPMRLQYVLRDVHAEHLLFPDATSLEGCPPTGLIDFDAVRIDSPIADLARWIGGFAASRSEQTWQRAMADYFQRSPSHWEDPTDAGFASVTSDAESAQMAESLPLAYDLAHATRWISLANWLVWTLIDRRPFSASPQRVARRIADWIRLCEDEGPVRG